mmetsp:Transcript_11867/g.35362  ORF Transcript_11867/g.35362 Transcript_11867/m.35362 type:complete len:429 (-) Transcript_11867:32-1318(-)
MRAILMATLLTKAAAGRVVVVGGGASGYFAAISAARRGADVTILEATRKPLKKVLASGGGRCNVMHDPTMAVADVVERYPRGRRELRGPFSSVFGPADCRAWFEAEGVALKTEADGRVFPTTDDSSTVAGALEAAAKRAGVRVRTGAAALGVEAAGDGFAVAVKGGDAVAADAVVLSTGSSRAGYALAKALGHTPVAPFPSLFSFRVADAAIAGLAGLSLADAELTIAGPKPKGPRPPTRGPLLVTHRGLSGPAALRLSAFRAKELEDAAYKGTLLLDALPDDSFDACRAAVEAHRRKHPKATVCGAVRPFEQIPKRLWARLAERAGASAEARWADCGKKQTEQLVAACKRLELPFDGKDTNKDEFVTAGGVSLKEIDMKTFASKLVPGLYVTGELLNVDGVTGGFNFMNCWCSGFAAGAHAAEFGAS